MPNPVVHWEIEAKNPAKLQEFYRTLFDWHVDADNPMNYGMVDTHAEGGINGGISVAEEGSTQSTTIYVEVPDLQAALDKATSLGAKVVMPITVIPDVVTMAKFQDPEGHIVGLMKSDS
ncbi:MAG: glyoxalase [Chloroflexi bacterium]|nr:glyoxalase [Chloroflexota bacterium]